MGTQRQRLTQGRVNSFVCPQGKQQDFLRDSEQRGLALRATKASKAYVYEGKLSGKTIRVTLGDPVSMTLEQARREAAKVRLMVAEGRDPRVVKAERTAADMSQREKSVAHKQRAIEIWALYQDSRSNAGRRPWSKRTLLDHQRLVDPGGKAKTRGRKKGEGDTTVPGELYGLLQLPLNKIDQYAVQDWLAENGHRETRARFAYDRLRAFLNWCARRPEYQDAVHLDACTDQDVKEAVPNVRVKKDSLERQHLKLWFEYVRKLSNPVQSAYLQTVLLTGARREEIAAVKWSDVDFTWRCIEIGDKVEESRVIPMPPYLASLLLNLKQLNEKPPTTQRLAALKKKGEEWAPSPWVFSSPRAASGRIEEPRAAHNKVLAQAGLPHISIHGLRRSFGSLSEWFEIPAGVIPQIQGHKPNATAEKHYRVRPIDLLYKWHSEYERWLLEQAGIRQPQSEDTLIGGHAK